MPCCPLHPSRPSDPRWFTVKACSSLFCSSVPPRGSPVFYLQVPPFRACGSFPTPSSASLPCHPPSCSATQTTNSSQSDFPFSLSHSFLTSFHIPKPEDGNSRRSRPGIAKRHGQAVSQFQTKGPGCLSLFNQVVGPLLESH